MRQLNRKIWPFSINIDLGDDTDKAETIKRKIAMDNWCSQTVGTRFRDWYSYNLGKQIRTYAFKTEEELVVFKLRWKYK